MPTWSPKSTRSTMRPTKRFGQPSSSGTPPGPSCHSQRANLSTSSPVSPPNSSASSPASSGTRWIAIVSAPLATRNVRFLSEMPARKRGGWMLHWVANPIRQPARSPPAATVAMNIG